MENAKNKMFWPRALFVPSRSTYFLLHPDNFCSPKFFASIYNNPDFIIFDLAYFSRILRIISERAYKKYRVYISKYISKIARRSWPGWPNANFSPPEGRLLSQEQRSPRREILSIVWSRGAAWNDTPSIFFIILRIYICIYILYLPYKKYSASTYNSTQPRYILPENLSKHLVRKRRREKKKRKKKRKREIARNFAGLGGNFESTRCEKRKRCCERSVSWKSHISRSKHENRVEKDPRFPSSCSIRIRDERFVVLIVAKKKKEKKRKNCGERVESFSNRFSFFFLKSGDRV